MSDEGEFWICCLQILILVLPTVFEISGWQGVLLSLLFVGIVIVVWIVFDWVSLLGLGIVVIATIAVLYVLGGRLEKLEKLKKRKETVAWELEDQLKELKEQLGRGAITQEEYEQQKKKLLEKSKA